MLSVSSVPLDLMSLIKGLALGVAGSVLAALKPAREATAVAPRAALQRSTLERDARAAVRRGSQVGAIEVGTIEVGAIEVGTIEVGTIEVGAIEVGYYIGIIISPLIPNLSPFSENFKVLFVCHLLWYR